MRILHIFPKILLLFILLTTIGCTTNAKNLRSIQIVKLNPELLLTWNKATSDSSTALREVIYKFEKNGKRLLYLQAGHGTDKNAKTFAAIDWIYKNNKPDVAIVEGFPSALGLSPASITEQMSKNVKGDFYPDGEVSYMVIKANEEKVPFIGGESTPQDSLQKIKEAGYTVNDMIGFMFVRVIPQKIRSGELTGTNVNKVYDVYARNKASELGLTNVMSFRDFKKWYKNGQKKNFQLDKIENGEAAPIDDGALLTQKISLLDIQAREEAIIRTIETMLNQYNTVFIAYGSSHYRLEHQIFKDYFGQPQQIDKF